MSERPVRAGLASFSLSHAIIHPYERMMPMKYMIASDIHGSALYARKMAEKDARVFIGQLIAGETDGLIAFEKENSLYSLLVGIKPANLNLWASRPLDKDETDCVRAAYIREYLPQICSWS